MRPSRNPEKARQRIASDLDAWLSQGNRIQRIPSGLSGERAITQPPQRRKGMRQVGHTPSTPGPG